MRAEVSGGGPVFTSTRSMGLRYDRSMDAHESEAMARRLRQTFDMFDAGVSMMRARLRREHPDADDREIDHLVRVWLHTRPGAEHGDSPGRLRRVDLEAS